jgi:CoA binding protein
MATPQQILESAGSVLLVDWPSTAVPRALLEAGLAVYGASPAGYTRAELVVEPPAGVRSHPPERPGDTGHLVFHRIDRRPDHVDLVHAFRPPDELAGILADHAIPLGASALWLQPPVVSADARERAEAAGLAFVEGIDIVDLARSLRH